MRSGVYALALEMGEYMDWEWVGALEKRLSYDSVAHVAIVNRDNRSKKQYGAHCRSPISADDGYLGYS